jgi:dimethylhistidine N-methyltransferase
MSFAAARPLDVASPHSQVGEDVRRGLTMRPKRLPPYLFYDDAGSELYERITELPEYYPTRTERAIFEAHGEAMIARAFMGAGSRPLGVVELGAGSATKTELLLRAVLRRQPRCTYVPIDVSRSAIDAAARRLAVDLPAVDVRPLVGTHASAMRDLRRSPAPAPQLALFIGSSVGNLEDDEASSLLRGLRAALGPECRLLLGTDLRKSPDVLIPAYDDAAGVTAAFNLNVLTRINRELGGRFDLARFRHVAVWNDAASRIEMHLESRTRQEVAIDALGIKVPFFAGETIHTESSIKYDLPRVERLLGAGGFGLEATYFDQAERFAVHLARAH